jgi:hypothetical protein
MRAQRIGDPKRLGEGMIMAYRGALEALALATVLLAPIEGAWAQEKKYPSWKGEWTTIIPRLPGQNLRFDPNKSFGPAQGAPLTAEYQKIYEANLAELQTGSQGLFLDHASCLPAGMPTMMSAGTHEYIITPETTYISVNTDLRRIFTDGRPWPTDADATYQGFSIGHWLDEDNDGVYDVLEVETHGPFKGPRAYDATGLPLHSDNQSVFKERIFRDKTDPNILHDVVTVIDNALTRPWVVDKKYRHNPRYRWTESTCIETNSMVAIGRESYFMSADGMLMPVRKNQPPPDLRYFKEWTK